MIDKWRALPPERKKELRDQEKSLHGKSEEERKRFKEKMERWKSLKDEQREAIRSQIRERREQREKSDRSGRKQDN
jgi:anti-sigma factor RsiW